MDYANVFASLERALALYGAGQGGQTPVRDKEALVGELRTTLTNLESFCLGVGVSVKALETAPTALQRLTLVGHAVNELISTDERRKGFLAQARLAQKLYAAIKPHKAAVEFAARMFTIIALAEKIQEETAPEKADLADVLQRIGDVLDRSIEGTRGVADGPPPIDLSLIDFKALASRFQESEAKNLDLERLKAAIRAQLDKLITANETRVDLVAIEEALDDGLPRVYTPEVFKAKAGVVFQHVYERFGRAA